MNIPGFTAEAAFYKATKQYFLAATFEASVVSTNVYLQRVSGPFGPFGLPGQDCSGACTHLCMLSGRASQECISSCMSTCTGFPLRNGLIGI
jgi:hypothetical protein